MREREKIIKHLQNISSELFPAELGWLPIEVDPFMVEYVESVKGCDHEEMKIRYRFYEHFMVISYSREIEYQLFYYGTLIRCRTLLLNAVRSVDEPQQGVAGVYEIAIDKDNIKILGVSVGRARSRVVWENGEFKWNTK